MGARVRLAHDAGKGLIKQNYSTSLANKDLRGEFVRVYWYSSTGHNVPHNRRSKMRFMVMVANGMTAGCVTRTKAQAYSWLKANKHEGVTAWRYHTGNGWADGSEDAWKHIQSLPKTVSVQIYR